MEAVQLSVKGEKNQKEIKNLFLFSAGKTVSIFGTAIYNFALGLYVLKLTGSALSFAVTLILGVIPIVIISPFAGVIADKFNKKALVVSMDLLNGILLISVYILSTLFGLNLVLIYITTFLLTVFTIFYGVGLEAAKPNIVSDKMLMNINSISKIIDSVSSILGPMLGGLVFAIFDIRTFIIINGISFLLSGLSAMLIDFKLNMQKNTASPKGGKINFFQDIREGFQYLSQRKSIMNLFVILISINFFLGFGLSVPLPYMLNTVLKLGSRDYGIIQGAFPLGMIIGALFVKKISAKINYPTLLNYLCLSMAIAMIFSGIPVMIKGAHWGHIPYILYYGTVMLSFGMIIALIDIPIAYLMQKMIPDEYRGRVMSISMSIGKTMLPIAMLASGLLLSLIPSYILPLAGGVLFFLFNLRFSSKTNIDLTAESIS